MGHLASSLKAEEEEEEEGEVEEVVVMGSMVTLEEEGCR